MVIGFRGYPWHTHADILASLTGFSAEDAVRAYMDDLLNDRAIIAVQSFDDVVKDVWITEDPAADLRYQEPDTAPRFRYGSGREYAETD